MRRSWEKLLACDSRNGNSVQAAKARHQLPIAPSSSEVGVMRVRDTLNCHDLRGVERVYRLLVTFGGLWKAAPEGKYAQLCWLVSVLNCEARLLHELPVVGRYVSGGDESYCHFYPSSHMHT